MSAFQQVVRSDESAILSGWLGEMSTVTRRSDLMSDVDMKQQATEFLRLFTEASQSNTDVKSDAFSSTREFLKAIAKSRMEQGFSPVGTGHVCPLAETANL